MYDPFLTALVLTASIAMLPVIFMLYCYLLRKATHTVISTFRNHNALTESNAKSLQELGLMPKHPFDPFKPALRDYKPQALQTLIFHEIIQITEEQKLYLSEKILFEKIPQVE